MEPETGAPFPLWIALRRTNFETLATNYATIGDIVTGKKLPRHSNEERIIAIPIGMAICDISLGHTVYHLANQQGVGQRFALS